MPLQPRILERAYALAKSGPCSSISEIRDTLLAEGFNHPQLRQITATVASDLCAIMVRRLATEGPAPDNAQEPLTSQGKA